MKFVLALSLFPALALASADDSALKLVPSRELQGITITSCEKKAPTYTVSCKATGCTVNIVAEKISCKGVRQ